VNSFDQASNRLEMDLADSLAYHVTTSPGIAAEAGRRRAADA